MLSVNPVSVKAQTGAPLPGEVRVLLTEYRDLTQIEIGVHGAYTLENNISFQRGSRIKVALIDNLLQVSYEGMVYLGGSTLVLKQHLGQAELENGLRLQGQMNLFPGSLRISVKDGKLELISILPIEQYLKGVVPFEMADEFPLQALKAQAVAARTYTLAHLDAGATYDVVDNTNDQVYRGVNPDKVNAIKAVSETTGLVLMYQGKLANCLYTASNGGYAESAYNAWGRENIPYLQIQKDPYDLENPLSIVKTAAIGKNPASPDEQTAAFFAYLKSLAYLNEQKADANLKPEAVRIIGVKTMTPHTSKYGNEDMGVLTQLKIGMDIETTRLVEVTESDQDTEVSLLSPAATPTPEAPEKKQYVEKKEQKTIYLDVPVFPDLEQLLSLSINRNENEVISVEEEESRFLIRFRRYGHGVGMSQRGAEWMAKNHLWQFEQILRFYYPGTELQRQELLSPTLPGLSASFVTTPGPPPTATPRPTLMPQSSLSEAGQKIVVVTGIEPNSSLNLRSKPDYLGDIITRLYYGQELLVLKQFEDGWLEVKTDAVSGFIREEFVEDKDK